LNITCNIRITLRLFSLLKDKYDRARIKVEHIIREDYLVEAMEIVEMYCDLLLARFGLLESMKFDFFTLNKEEIPSFIF
jgi:hypothetical protein